MKTYVWRETAVVLRFSWSTGHDKLDVLSLLRSFRFWLRKHSGLIDCLLNFLQVLLQTTMTV
jgi:hypothetical protein